MSTILGRLIDLNAGGVTPVAFPVGSRWSRGDHVAPALLLGIGGRLEPGGGGCTVGWRRRLGWPTGGVEGAISGIPYWLLGPDYSMTIRLVQFKVLKTGNQYSPHPVMSVRESIFYFPIKILFGTHEFYIIFIGISPKTLQFLQELEKILRIPNRA